MQDLTEHFVQALQHRDAWNAEQLYAALRALSARLEVRLEWDADSSEKWIKLSDVKQRTVALEWSIAPLAVIKSSAPQVFHDFLRDHGAFREIVDDWNAPRFTINPESVRAAGLPRFWRTDPEAVSTSGFSILDLLYVTDD